MDPFVFVAVLAAAAFHAGWNALLKVRLEPIIAICLMSVACGIVSLPFLPFVELPKAAAWPYIAGSLAIHLIYYFALAEAYRFGDLSQVYPIARGTAPLITALGASAWLGETLGTQGTIGIIVLAAGIITLSLRGAGDLGKFDFRSVGFALLTALTIAAYTLVDGIGARMNETAAPYIVWLFVLDGVIVGAIGVVLAPARLVAGAREGWRLMLLGGAMATAAYAIAIWAMTKAPIALVAALRETSVLFAALIGIVVLREPVVPTRILAAILVVTGILLLRFR